MPNVQRAPGRRAGRSGDPRLEGPGAESLRIWPGKRWQGSSRQWRRVCPGPSWERAHIYGELTRDIEKAM